MLSGLLKRGGSSKIFSKNQGFFSTLVIAEHNNGKMNPVTSKMLTAATNFQQEVLKKSSFCKQF